MSASLAVGLVGMGGRGRSFKPAFDANSDVRVLAVCDLADQAANAGQELFEAKAAYRAYDEMLRAENLDAVVIGTPAPYHVPQAIAALERDLHVFSEVPAGVSVDQCRELVRTHADSGGEYLMLENFIYLRSNAIVTEMVDSGLFGDVYYGEGEYLHELRALNERTPWRREWQTGINGITYPTHSLGPILEWMEDDRIERVTCVGSGRHHRDAQGRKYELEDTTVMLGETDQGGLIKMRLDMLSDRPDAIDNYQIQGTKGCYESSRRPREDDTVWLAQKEQASDSGDYEWLDLENFVPEYLPRVWQEIPAGFPNETKDDDGNDGLAFRDRILTADYVMMTEFLDALLHGGEIPVGIHQAMDMTLPGLVSQASISDGGEWLPVPDSREWI